MKGNLLIDNFTKKIKSKFKNRIIFLVYFGSNRYERGTSMSDYDMYLLLNSIKISDDNLIKILNKEFPEIDLAIFYKDLLPKNPAFFINETQGAYFLECLTLGKVLAGNNKLIKEYFSLLTEKDQKKSLYLKILNYYTKLLKRRCEDQEFLKYYIRVLQNILMLLDMENLNKLRFLNREKIILKAKSHGLLNENSATFILNFLKNNNRVNRGVLLKSVADLLKNTKIKKYSQTDFI